MTGHNAAIAEPPLGATRTFRLMAIGVDEEAEPAPRTHAVAPKLPALIGARPFAIMAIRTLDDEPATVADIAA